MLTGGLSNQKGLSSQASAFCAVLCRCAVPGKDPGSALRSCTRRSATAFRAADWLSCMQLAALDVLFGSQKVVEAVFFLSGHLDVPALRRSLDLFAFSNPCFAARIRRPQWCAASPFTGWHLLPQRGGSIPLHVCPGADCSLAEAQAAAPRSTSRYFRGGRPTTAAEVMRGRAPVMSVSVTHFAGGGSALAVEMSHALVDAHGFHSAVREWARLHRSPAAARPLRMSRGCIESLLPPPSTLKPRAGALDLRGWRGAGVWWLLRRIAAPGFGARPPRARLHYTPEALAALRERGTAAAGHRCTTTAALCGPWAGAVAELSGQGPAHVLVPVDMRGRRSDGRVPADYVGNAVHVLGLRLGAGGAVAALNALGRQLRGPPGGALEDWISFAGHCDAGYLWDPAAAEGPAVVVNAQQRLPMIVGLEDVFGAGRCLSVVPGAGDHVHVVPAAGGGVHVLLNLGPIRGSWGWLEQVEADRGMQGMASGERHRG